MKALTVCEPYATAIIAGAKPIENRDWQCHHRGLLVIHAGKSRKWMTELSDEQRATFPDDDPYNPDALQFGVVLGIVNVTGCAPYEPSQPFFDNPWAFGNWCIQMATPIKLHAFECRGMMGLWNVPDWAERLIKNQLHSKGLDANDPYKEAA